MDSYKDVLTPEKWTASFSGGGFAGAYNHIGRNVLLSDVTEQDDESSLSICVEISEGQDYHLSFLFYPEVTAAKESAVIFDIEGVVSVKQSDYTAPGAFWIEFSGERKQSPDYTLFRDKWNFFDFLFLADGSSALLVNGRYMGGKKQPGSLLPTSLRVSMGCGKSQASFMWDKVVLAEIMENDVRLSDFALYEHGFFRSITFSSPDMNMLFDGRCVRGDDLYTQGDWQYPGFQTGSTLYGHPLTDMDEVACFGIRKHGISCTNPDTNRLELHCHHDYDIEVHSTGGNVIAFSTTSNAVFSPLRCTATYYLFSSLPGVIFCNCFFENTFHDPVPELASANFAGMIFTQGERDVKGNKHIPAYNGVRLWPKASEHLRYFFGLHPAKEYSKPDEKTHENGVFIKWQRNRNGFYGAWLTGETFSLARGLAVMQKDGKTDWTVNPPIGNIITDKRHYGTFTTCGDEYTSIASELRLKDDMSLPGSTGDEEVIFFSLKPECPVNTEESLYNLERSFNLPLAVSVEPLIAGARPQVCLCELDGVYREWQFVSMPWLYGDIEFAADIGDVFYGNAFSGRRPVKTVLLLRDVKPYERKIIGQLPIMLSCNKTDEWIVENGLSAMHKNLWLHIVTDNLEIRSVIADRGEIKAWRIYDGRMEICANMKPGITKLKLIVDKDIVLI